MKNKIFSTVLFLIFLIVEGWGQCGTDEIHEMLLKTDAVYREQIISQEKQLQRVLENQPLQKTDPSILNTVYTIPVVVHVIHTGETVGTGTNISDSQIQAAINGLNNGFKNISGDGVDVEINFCLAVRDPNGNPTTGINRVNGSGVANYVSKGINASSTTCGGANENSIRNLSKWPASDYYNIWVVNKICGGWAGWSYYPGNASYDGTAIMAAYMKSSYSTLTHEVGHGFFLYHTFEGDGGNSHCPSNTSCTSQGDKVCDTPPHKRGDCGNTNTCTTNGIWDNSRYNYMGYCSSSNANCRFTQGQKNRMRAQLLIAPRASLLNSQGCNPTTSTASQTITVGTGSGTSGPTPYWTNYMDEKCQFIVTKSELTAAGWTSANSYIRSLAFYVASASPKMMNSFSIKIRHTTGTQFTSTSFFSGSGMITVYSGNLTVVANSWNIHTFSTPFAYNGVDNLLIEICWNNNSFYTSSTVRSTPTSSYKFISYLANNTTGGVCATTAGASRNYNRPNIRMVFKNNATGKYGAESEITLEAPTEESNIILYPNPTSSVLNVDYNVTEENSSVLISIYDMKGALLASKQDDAIKAGNHTYIFDFIHETKTSSPTNGIFLCMVNINGKVETRRFMLAK